MPARARMICWRGRIFHPWRLAFRNAPNEIHIAAGQGCEHQKPKGRRIELRIAPAPRWKRHIGTGTAKPINPFESWGKQLYTQRTARPGYSCRHYYSKKFSVPGSG